MRLPLCLWLPLCLRVLCFHTFTLLLPGEADEKLLPSKAGEELLTGEADERSESVPASAGAFATITVGAPSAANVTETELVTMAVTLKLPLALAI